MAGLSAICDCGKEFRTNAAGNPLCPDCQRIEDEMYANDPRPVQEIEDQPWPWSRTAMRERLGVTGDVDE